MLGCRTSRCAGDSVSNGLTCGIYLLIYCDHRDVICEFVLLRMSCKRKLFALNADQEREICVYHGNNAWKAQQEIANVLSVRFDNPVSRKNVGDIPADKSKWLDNANSNNVKRVRRLGKHADLESALEIRFSNARSQNVVTLDATLREKRNSLVRSLASMISPVFHSDIRPGGGLCPPGERLGPPGKCDKKFLGGFAQTS
jgi:hypothetical protein